MKNTKKGFTLVELLVVIAILAILASVSVVGYTAFISKADKQALEVDCKNIESIIEAELALTGECTIETGIVAKRVNGKIILHDASGTALTAAPSHTSFTHEQLTQFNTKTPSSGTPEWTVTYTVGSDSANATITITSSKLAAGSNSVTITLD